MGKLVEGSSTRDEEGYWYGTSLSQKRIRGGGLGGLPSQWILSAMLGKSPDVDISLHGNSFPSEGNLVFWGVGAPITGTLIDEWRRALVVWHLFTRDSLERTLREGSFTVEPEGWGFWEISKMSCKRSPLSMGALLGTWKGFFGRDFWEKIKVYLGPFLGHGGH